MEKVSEKKEIQREKEILTPEAVNFVFALVERFGDRIVQLLDQRRQVKDSIRAGKMPTFLEETAHIREGKWKVAPYPSELKDRRVEITSPVDRKMMINALNSGANVFMADFEDSLSPRWWNCIQGQINLKDAVEGNLRYEAADGRIYEVGEDPAILFVRPRGLHLVESLFRVGNDPAPASLVDFGLFFFHNAARLVEKGSGPYFYLPKLESYLEARLWDEIFSWAEEQIGIGHGTTKATVLIEHVLAAFQMDEILYELRDHSVGLNSGRWDYMFSFIKTFSHDSRFILPDRSRVTMDKGFLKAYVNLLVQTCHRRGTFAIGGMSAYIPIRDDAEANARALERVYLDKLREVKAGHDGTWIAHPGLLEVARRAFDEYMPEPNQIHRKLEGLEIGPADLLEVPTGPVTERGVRENISVCLQYLMHWLNGRGAVAIYNLMEDAATAEISRSQLWQWLHHEVTLERGGIFDSDFFNRVLNEEYEKLDVGEESLKRPLGKAKQLLKDVTESPTMVEFITLPAYHILVEETDQ